MDNKINRISPHLPGWGVVKDRLSIEISKYIPKTDNIDLSYILYKYYSLLDKVIPLPNMDYHEYTSLRMWKKEVKDNVQKKLMDIKYSIRMCPKWDLEYSLDVIDMNMIYLKNQVLKNNGVVIGNKKCKNTWSKAYINLQNISLSMVKMRVPDDVGSIIGEYLPNRDTQFTIFVGSAVWMTRMMNIFQMCKPREAPLLLWELSLD